VADHMKGSVNGSTTGSSSNVGKAGFGKETPVFSIGYTSGMGFAAIAGMKEKANKPMNSSEVFFMVFKVVTT